MSDYFSHETTYTYTDTGQVSTVTAPGSKVWTYAYNALGQPTSVAIPNGMTTEYAYDTRDRLTKIEHKDGSTVLDGFTYALDDGGNITTTTHADSSLWDYEYDGRDRLTKAERYDTDGTTLLHRYSYTYDDGDNLLTKLVYDGTNTVTTSYAVNNANEMTSMSVGGTTTTFAYDALGRTTSKTDGTYTASYTYGPAGMLSTVGSDFPGEDNAAYQTGGDGKRRSRTVDGTETWYNWAGASVINQEDSAGVLTRTYFGHTAAHVDGASPSTGSYEYYFPDHLGSTRRLRAQDKSSLGAYEYTPYGEVYAESGVTSITRRYAMLDWDGAVQQYFAPFRYYVPGAGRWTSRDPLEVDPNLYGYCYAAPTVYIDPNGDLCIFLGALVIIAAVGALVWWERKHGSPGAALGYGAEAAAEAAPNLLPIITGNNVGVIAGTLGAVLPAGVSVANAAPGVLEGMQMMDKRRKMIYQYEEGSADTWAAGPDELVQKPITREMLDREEYLRECKRRTSGKPTR